MESYVYVTCEVKNMDPHYRSISEFPDVCSLSQSIVIMQNCEKKTFYLILQIVCTSRSSTLGFNKDTIHCLNV